MAYITTADLSARLGDAFYARLTDRAGGVAANATVAQQIVNDAEAEADAYLARRYATPVDLNAHPELANVLKARVLDLAEHAAWRGSPFVSSPPDRVSTLYESARRWLESVARGELPLPAGAAPAGPTAQRDGIRVASSPRRFTAEELDGL